MKILDYIGIVFGVLTLIGLLILVTIYLFPQAFSTPNRVFVPVGDCYKGQSGWEFCPIYFDGDYSYIEVYKNEVLEETHFNMPGASFEYGPYNIVCAGPTLLVYQDK